MRNPWVGVGALMALLSVAIGAFGAHALRGQVPPERLEVFQTGVQYHQMHAIALVLLGLFEAYRERTTLSALAGALFLLGILVFAGSLYILTVTGQRAWGAVTPIGGVALQIAWVLFAIAAFKTEKAA